MITPITATFPALNFPKEVDYPTQEDWAAFSAAAELNYGILSGTWSDKSEEFKAQTNNLALEIQAIGENAFNAISLNTIEDLATYSGTGLVIIKDINRGGTFVSKSVTEIDPNTGSLYVVNGGTVFAKLGGGFWVRQYSGAVNVKWFGARGDWNGTTGTDDTLAIQKAIELYPDICIPSGKYKCTDNINIPNERNIKGDGITTTQVIFTNDTDGFKSINPINSSNAAYVYISDMAIISSPFSSTKSGFVNVAGTFVDIDNVVLQGWEYGIIFDQTEIATIRKCTFDHNYGGIWLVNGNDYSAGANAMYTNRITISNNEFNETQYGIIDDGGVAHSITDNNINGGVVGIRASGALSLLILGNEIEYCSSAAILLEFRTLIANRNTGQCRQININTNFIISKLNTIAISLNNATNLNIENNTFDPQGGTSTTYAITGGVNNIGGYYKNNKYSGYIGFIDSYRNSVMVQNRINSYSTIPSSWNQNSIVTQVENYAIESYNGLTCQIMLNSYRNTSNANIYKTSNFATSYSQFNGTHTFLVAPSGTAENTISFIAAATISNNGDFTTYGNHIPTSDNNRTLGSSSLRWSTVYAGTGTINTSDDREKTYIDITEVEKKVAIELKANMKKFKFNNSIEEKGEDKARIHFGASAQTIKAIFEKYELNAFNYSILCYDEWEEQEEIQNEEGTIIQEYKPSGDRYGLRYEELLSFIIGCI